MAKGWRLPQAKDFAPPVGWEKAPAGRKILAKAYQRKLITLAADFDEYATLGGERLKHRNLCKEAGKLITAICNDGFLADVPNLHARVQYHSAPPDPMEPTRGNPVNLFGDVVGGRTVLIHQDEAGKTVAVTPGDGDGILPSLCPQVFGEDVTKRLVISPDADRQRMIRRVHKEAEACRFLASLIGEEVPKPEDGGVLNCPAEFRSQPLTAKKVAENMGVFGHTKPSKWIDESGLPHERIGKKYIVDIRRYATKKP